MRLAWIVLPFLCNTALADNLIPNPTFNDSKQVSWSFGAKNAQYAHDVLARGGRDGSGCIQMGNARERAGLTFKDIPIRKKADYLYSIWYRTEGLDDYQVWIRAHFKRRDGSDQLQFVKKLPASRDWVEAKLWINDINEKCDTVQLVVQLREGAKGSIWVDDVFFGEAAGKQEPFKSPYPIPELKGKRPEKRLAGSGYYRVEKLDGVWWLVDPQGELFWSIGVCTVGEGNEKMDKYLAQAHGKGFEIPYHKQSYDRLLDWGFNSAGCFSSMQRGAWNIRDYNRERQSKGLRPVGYFAPLGCSLAGLRESEAIARQIFLTNAKGELQNKFHFHKFPDPFHPEWRSGLAASVRRKTQDVATDPNMIGYFVDNEITIDGLHDFIYSPYCLQEFVAFLKKRYREPGGLNRAWSNGGQTFRYSSIDAEELKTNPPRLAGPGDTVTRDLKEFTRYVVEVYVDQTIAAIRSCDRNHLIIGNRIASPGEPLDYWDGTSHVMAPLGKYDLVAANFYPKPMNNEDRVDYNARVALEWLTLYHEATGRPIIIGEFGVAARDSDVPSVARWQSRTLDTQAQRGDAYKKMVYSYYNLPYIVGAHWFRWSNGYTEGGAPTPRNCGLVDDENRPYGEFIRYVEEANAAIGRAGRQASFGLDDLPFPKQKPPIQR
ncbi:MAG: beta-galactosidase [Planctomycetota bacterium]